MTILGIIWMFAVGADYVEIGPGAEFSVWGLSIEAARSYFWLASIALIVVIDRRSWDFVLLSAAAACALLPVWLTWLVTYQIWRTVSPESFAQYGTTAWWVVFAWQIAVFWRVLLTPYQARFRRTVPLTLIYALMLYANIFALPDRPLFYSREYHTDRKQLNVEDTYYQQAGLTDAMLRSLAHERPGTVDMFFLGFGGYASQGVFMREIDQVRDIFDRHFGTEGRSGMLINNLDTVDKIPLANRHNLERMITGTAEIMNPAEDILFLFVSSHGSKNAKVSVDFAPLGLNDLTATELRSMLDAAAIRWRVIVISACFSGSFIEPLTTPGTLIITAAAADRTSFGCSHERDWTYFGEAFFRTAVLESASFVDAFDRAKSAIEKRERDEDISPSLPQIFVGSEIAPRLEQWRKDLGSAGSIRPAR